MMRSTTSTVVLLPLLLLLVCLLATIHRAEGFLPNAPPTTSTSTSSTSSSRTLGWKSSSRPQPHVILSAAADKSIVVLSPPGGVGEVAAVSAAKMGASVRWFVVSRQPDPDGITMSDDTGVVTLSPQAFQEISNANGNLQVAGATVEDLLEGGDALTAVSTWCGGKGDAIVCTYDGCDGGFLGESFKSSLRLAAREASKTIQGPHIAVLTAEEEVDADNDSEKDEKSGGFLDGLFSEKLTIPESLTQALQGGGGSGGGRTTTTTTTIRHGELFGLPESSPDFSPLVGGLLSDATVTEEYSMRDVRVDPFVFSGNVLASSSLKACRHAVGDVAAKMATSELPLPSETISVSSQSGTETFTTEQWKDELKRVEDLLASGQASVLFNQEMIVDNTERLAEWLATKWAPAVLRTYDIAAIRIGARPVYALKRDNEAKVEIVWQELIDFDKTVITGTMILEVTNDGITARRGPGGPSAKSISRKPLPGEEVLVRQLGEATSQAFDKGLAKKILKAKPVKAKTVEVPAVTSVVSSGTVKEPVVLAEEPVSTTGPRKAGARRSTPRQRRGSSSDK